MVTPDGAAEMPEEQDALDSAREVMADAGLQIRYEALMSTVQPLLQAAAYVRQYLYTIGIDSEAVDQMVAKLWDTWLTPESVQIVVSGDNNTQDG